MSVSVGSKDNVSVIDSFVGYTRRRQKKNDNGPWEDSPQSQYGFYKTWQNFRSPVINSPVLPNGWRDPTSYNRTCRRWSFLQETREDPWIPTGVVNSAGVEYSRDIYTGVWSGDQHFFDRRNAGFDYLDVENVLNMVQMRCLNKIGDQKVQMGQMMLEAYKTAETLADTAIPFLTAILQAKHGNWKRIPKTLGLSPKGAADNWLKYQYGWAPLMSDIYAAHENFRGIKPRPMLFSATDRYRNAYSGSGPYFNGEQDKIVYAKLRAECKIYAKMRDELLSNAQRLGLTNPLQLAWELVPWSFALDWFVPVGNTLQSLSASVGLDFVGGYVSSALEGKFSMKASHVGRIECEELEFSRVKLNNFPRPLLYANPDPFKSSTRIKNAVALFVQCL